MSSKTKLCSYTLSEDTIFMLEYLTSKLGSRPNKSQVIKNLVASEYTKIKGLELAGA